MFRNLSTEGLGVSGHQSEFIELALSFGFKGIDLDLVDFQQQVQVNGLARARRLLDSAKLKIGTFRLPLVWDDTDEIYQQGLQPLAESLKLAADLGATRAVTGLCRPTMPGPITRISNSIAVGSRSLARFWRRTRCGSASN